jgi:ABC-2 type transport system ATP-binding protein
MPPGDARSVTGSDGLAVEAVDLRRTFRTTTGTIRRTRREVDAVRGVSFGIEQGELFGLLGPNGAGKTTTIKMLITLLIPSSGTARVLGRDVVDDVREVRRRIGYVFGGDRGLYERLSARDNLRYFSELYGVHPRVQATRIDELLELVGLTGRDKERVEGFSRGMRQRLHIARGLLHDPDVLFLDEPSIGIDPVGARELRSTIGHLVGMGKTVLLTTHYMFEADELCDRIAVIREGEIVATGTPAQLKGRVAGGRVVEVETYGVPKDTLTAVGAVRGIRSVAVEERGQQQVLIIQCEHDAEVAQGVLARLGDVRVGRVTAREPTLEDAYVELVTGT